MVNYNSDLTQNIFGVSFKNPVLTASGTFGYGEVFADFYDVNLLGGFVTKAVTVEPRKGNVPPRIIETPSGMLNSIGLQNEGLDYFINNILPNLEKIKTVKIINVAGRSIEDYVQVCQALDDKKSIDAFEINISCPNVKKEGLSFGSSEESAASLVKELKKNIKKPLIIKLTPNVTSISSIAKAVESEGANAVSLINTITGMVIDVNKRKPMLANITGGLSGPAIRPVAVRMVYETAKKVNIPIIGMGGIFSARDALEFLIAGASLIQVGCGNFVKPNLPLDIISGISDYLYSNDIEKIKDIIGSVDISDCF